MDQTTFSWSLLSRGLEQVKVPVRAMSVWITTAVKSARLILEGSSETPETDVGQLSTRT
jgi:hypothetical protein